MSYAINLKQAMADVMFDRWGGDDDSRAEYLDAATSLLLLFVEPHGETVEQVAQALGHDHWETYGVLAPDGEYERQARAALMALGGA
jgi:hypothetical protein